MSTVRLTRLALLKFVRGLIIIFHLNRLGISSWATTNQCRSNRGRAHPDTSQAVRHTVVVQIPLIRSSPMRLLVLKRTNKSSPLVYDYNLLHEEHCANAIFGAVVGKEEKIQR